MSEVDTSAATDNAASETLSADQITALAAEVFGEDAQPAAAVAETPKAEPPKVEPAAEKVSARIIAAKRADLRAAEVRKELASQRAELDKGRSELAELAKVADQVKAAKLSPSKALELLGFDAKTFLESLATEHEPDAIAARAVAGTQSEVQKLQARIDAMEKAAEDAQKAARMKAADAEAQHAGTGFLEFVGTNAEKYPALVEVYTPRQIVNEGFRILHEVIGKDREGNPVSRLDAYMAEHGHPPDDDEIAEFLEQQAQPLAQERTEWRARIGQKAPAPSQGIPTGDQRAAQMVPGPSPRTLTSRAASEKATAPSPKMTQEQMDEESIRILNASFKNTG